MSHAADLPGAAPAAGAAHEAVPFVLPKRAANLFLAAAVLGTAWFLVGIFASPERAWRGYLVGEVYFLGLALGAAFFVAVQHVASAGWSTALRRVPEAMSGTLPVAAVLFVPVLLGARRIYEWTDADAVAKDPVLRSKAAWLALPFFAVRALVYFAVWIGFTWAINRGSRLQDADGSLAHTRRNGKLSGLFIAAFAVTVSLAAFDWCMSLDPHWVSTIFGVYHFAGMFVSALATIVLAVVALRRHGPLRGVVQDAHLLDLGRLLVGFTTFWAYIWFCQYMLIWYSNLPEEASYYMARTGPGWWPMFVLNLLVNWLVPFALLLPRPNKQSERVLLGVSALLLFGRWIDLSLDISQPLARSGPPVPLWEVGPTLAAIGVFGLAFTRAFGRANPIPVKDPTIEESLHHHV